MTIEERLEKVERELAEAKGRLRQGLAARFLTSLKRIIAREWLVFICSVIAGFLMLLGIGFAFYDRIPSALKPPPTETVVGEEVWEFVPYNPPTDAVTDEEVSKPAADTVPAEEAWKPPPGARRIELIPVPRSEVVPGLAAVGSFLVYLAVQFIRSIRWAWKTCRSDRESPQACA